MSPKKIKRRSKRTRESRTRDSRVVSPEEFQAMLDRIETVASPDDVDLMRRMFDTLAFITQELEDATITLARLRRFLFGESEKTSEVLGTPAEPNEPENGKDEDGAQSDSPSDAPSEDSEPDKRKGHGRNAADDYTGAQKISVPHPALKHGDACPCEGCTGKVYRIAEPAKIVRVKGVAPLNATVYELERLRCNLCGEVFTAPAPEGVGDRKYDETAAAMIGLLKYGSGLPFNRMERLGRNLGMPLPSTTQWDVIEEAANKLEPVWDELIRQAAAGEVLTIDDTYAQVLSLNEEIRKEIERGEEDRTGIFTSGVVSTVGGRRIVLFFTARKHAGENLARVLAEREAGLDPPLQMADALSRNECTGEFETIVANCLVHARRNFVDVASSFPTEVEHVLLVLRDVYRNEAETKKLAMTAEERLDWHVRTSKPLMDDLKTWLQERFDHKLVEPNSTLGGAITYMLKRWDKLTRFLQIAGAPLDSNVVERALKRAILHRKNSLFYKTENGAKVGDMFMSLIHTCEQCDASPFDYLVAVQQYSSEAAERPDCWMPWNYHEALAELTPPDDLA